MKRKNKNGFTLIELLAVIVILAIIALIAVPVVMNIITKSRKSAFKDSAYGIIKAGELYYADRLLEPEGMTEDKMFTFPSDTTGLDIKGSKPRDGSVIVTTEGKVAIGVTDGKYCITKGYEDTDVTITEDVETCSNPEIPTLSKLATTGTFSKVDGTDVSEITEVNECATDTTEGACAPGTAFAIKVNENITHRFYVLEDYGNKVTLILDRNLGDDVAWASKADYNDDNYGEYGKNNKGPITALTYLQRQTSTWTNLLEMTISTFDYDDEREDVELGNNKVFKMYARLPKYSETYAINNSITLTNTPWLYINLYNTGDDTADSNGNKKYGYWTSAAASSRFSDARCVHYNGFVNGYQVNNAIVYGVRPVIELSK